MTRPPDPNTCHPTYAHYANTIRENLVKGGGIVIKATEFTPMMQLTIYEHTGSAPYVGDPDDFAVEPYYVWRSAIDSLGRAVAGPARLVMRVKV